MIDFLIFTGAIAALIYGAALVIKEAEKIALHFDISHFIIGATLIALGTSLPEMAASIKASFSGHGEIAVSNVLGSNIFNITMVLGFVFIVAHKMHPKRDIFSKDAVWAVIPVGILYIVLFDGHISRFEGVLLLIVMVAYLLFLLKDKESLEEELDDDIDDTKFGWGSTILYLILGFVLVGAGADFAIESASNIAERLGVSEWVIGLVLVAFGTSLPEFVVSLVAVKRGSGDMAMGNVIGSNLANISVVLGASSLVAPITFSLEESMFDIAAMGIVTLTLVFISAGKLYDRSAGLVLVSMLGLVIANAIGI